MNQTLSRLITCSSGGWSIVPFTVGCIAITTAVEQIKARNYHEKYMNRGKTMMLLGVGGVRDRTIADKMEAI